MTPQPATLMTRTTGGTPRSEDEASEVVDALHGVTKTIKQYGLIGLGLFAAGGGTAIVTIPGRLAKVEDDHISIRREQIQTRRHVARAEENSDWMVCVVGERVKVDGGDPNRCGPQPRRSRVLDDETSEDEEH